ncbi:cellulose synthase family protein [Flavobacterium degerlachei]|jgi:cellulose synthase/poly-beta-1,6-N-acetylglucosamine synthase-like glycosyltransferase|uniref:Glycosyltransferase, catalytic subunit of cellulose synthase and poly-beta-1,6-N-acetylglucosamine synthase n=1 Tax=Flavobacterium degerlachei TaxID=229203 RepID=A0A1H2ZG06_9FLAO|nr:cellulose synthase family protein [Flavobacterium degerlachei]SDX16422.1 Glycosyltransferase, catalytic subunit of cellulose synthase and poly-beta-1,6-N-acetylglucosamine synthase [Flavobacterium degerlachei]
MLQLSYIIVILYAISILLVFFYSLAQFNLLLNYLKSKKTKDQSIQFDFSNNEEIPYVTIQLPIYNEKYVIERLLTTIAKLEYPKDKLEIQVLDDSTDESVTETAALIQQIAATGIDIKQIKRTNRSGFKAGALKEGLVHAKGEFIAIFDADFVPQKDWLYKTIPYFKDPKIGVVQTRWGHLNRDYSLLTKIQAFALDAHFTLEQVGRNSKSHFINFNGTAGVWRKECILDAGNWESDTLTEDLDLSYRAQLKNWKFKYLEQVETPAELPAIISAARSQQFRWNKGGAENFSKNAIRLVQSKSTGFKTKVHGILHLLNSSMFLAIFVMAILSVPVLYIKNKYLQFDAIFDVLVFFVISSLLFFISYWVTFKSLHGGGYKNFLRYTRMFLTFYTIVMGFSFHNTIAVLEGLWGKKSDFIRTPKLNIEGLKDKWKQNSYLSKKISKNIFVEGGLILYFLFGIYSAVILNDYSIIALHFMLLTGFSFVFIKSITDNN